MHVAGGHFERNITRFTLPIRTVAFSVSGGMLAAAGDDDGVKVISTIDFSVVSVLRVSRRRVERGLKPFGNRAWELGSA